MDIADWNRRWRCKTEEMSMDEVTGFGMRKAAMAEAVRRAKFYPALHLEDSWL